jgi:beta-mannosidase
LGGHLRTALRGGWQICRVTPSTASPPAQATPPANASWIDAATLGPAAAVLRDAGLWSLDDAPQRFDADEWWYRLRFDAPAAAPGAMQVLGFDGLATAAEVWLNGEPLLSSANMFVAHECDVTARLQPRNELLLRFQSLDQLLAARRPRPAWRAPMIDNQQLRWWRTTLLGRTPGWSPPAAVVGPWRDIWLEERRGVQLEDIRLHTRVEQHAGIVDVTCRLATSTSAQLASPQLTLCVEHDAAVWRVDLRAQADATATVYRGSLEIPHVALWWPHTHGEPRLHPAWIEARDAAGTVQRLELGPLGFRSLTLNQMQGRFALSVNGVEVFCRGACWTPLDPVTLRSSPEAYRQAIAQARAAGMNMLRVGGTMVYEDPAFYDECDAQGVLVWQDFMFANMDYPDSDEAFMQSVKQEVTQQLEQWAARPSLAVLCGNSEGEQQAAMWGAPRERWSPTLFTQTIAEWAAATCPDVPYWPSSASNGPAAADALAPQHAIPHQANLGTTSYYGVGAYLRPLEDARRANVRFATECLAFANVPAPATLAAMPGGLSLRVHHPGWKTRAPRDLGAGWDFEDVRDHYLKLLFGIDPTALRYSDHERYLQLSRIASAEVMAATFNEWRRAESSCKGALVWFLRDLWAGAGWGVIGSDGLPKAAFHALKRSLQPVSAAISDEGVNGLYLHLVNEREAALPATVQLTLWRDGQTQVLRVERPLTLAPRSHQTIALGAWFDGFIDGSYAYRFGPPPADLISATLLSEQNEILSMTCHFPVGYATHREHDLDLRATGVLQGDGSVIVTLNTERLAQFVYFAADGFVADDEYFHLLPRSSRTVVLRPVPGQPTKPLRGSVQAINTHAVSRIELTAPTA